MNDSVDFIADAKPQRNWSSYQIAFFDFIENGRGDCVLEAVAGSGKTTSVVEATHRTHSDSVCVCAFNKSIATELQEKVGPGVVARTINSMGHGAVIQHLGVAPRQVKVDDRKYSDLIYTATEFVQHDDMPAVRKAISGLVSFAQSTLSEVDDDSFADLAEKYGIELPISEELPEPYFYDTARYVLGEGERMAREEYVIDFNDQIWLPNVWNAKPKQFDWVFVDEAQDLSRAKLELVLRCRRRGGRMIFVGDPRQSIYGFAGADPKAWYEIIERTNAKVLPLSVCYRCPSSHLDLVREIVPQIEARPDAPLGVIEYTTEEKVHEVVRNGDLILCRFTAPLLSMCLTLISHRIPARVKGRDIGKQLIGTAREALRFGTWNEFPSALEAYKTNKVALLMKTKRPDAKIQTLEDRVAGVFVCYEALAAEDSTFQQFANAVDAIFSDGASAVELSTVHKAKGLEAEHVFLLAPETLGVGRGTLAWQQEQERNLEYVAKTRSTDSLYFVTMKPRFKKGGRATMTGT